MTDEKKSANPNQQFPLRQIYFYLTEGCNLACRHCWLNPKLQTKNVSYPVLAYELFKPILDQAKPLGLSRVKLTGGEPLMHPQIHNILNIIKNENLPLFIETNGVLCTPELARDIADCRDAQVSISLDGADAETHEWIRGVPGSFDKAVEGIKNMVECGVKPQIIMSVMPHNKNQMEDVVRLAESLGVNYVKFNLIQPAGRGKKMNNDGGALTIDEYIELGEWFYNTLSKSTTISLFYHLPPAFRPLGKMFGKGGDSCLSCDILGIIGVLPQGYYALCGVGNHIPELTFGHVEKNRLEDVWNSNNVLLSIREGIPDHFKGICKNCIMKQKCKGNCLAMNYYSSSDIWTSYWFCEYAYKMGRFPETRLIPELSFV